MWKKVDFCRAGPVPDTGDRFTGKCIKRNTLVTDIKEKMEEKI